MRSQGRDLVFVIIALILAPLGSALQRTTVSRPFPYFYQTVADIAIVTLCFVLCVKSLRNNAPAWLLIACPSAIVGTIHLLNMLHGGPLR